MLSLSAISTEAQLNLDPSSLTSDLEPKHWKARVAIQSQQGAGGGYSHGRMGQLVPVPKLKPAAKIKQKHPHTQIHTGKKNKKQEAEKQRRDVRVMMKR